MYVLVNFQFHDDELICMAMPCKSTHDHEIEVHGGCMCNILYCCKICVFEN